MIREIGEAQFDDIDLIIDRYKEQKEEGTVPEDFANQIKVAVSDGNASVYCAYSEDDSVTGIALFGKVSHRISFVFAEGNLDTEKLLLSALFDRFSNEYSHITSGGQWISDDLSTHFVSVGFKRYDRMQMTLPRKKIESLDDLELQDGMCFEHYTDSMRDELSNLIFNGHNGRVDEGVFPQFFGTPEGCYRLLENIESSRFGEYRKSSSWILRYSNETIGVCYMTIRNGDAGYIPDIVIKNEYRGRGLGKTILVHSMKRLLESDPTLTKVDLDVTLSNDAFHLYKSLGFTKVVEYAVYTWKNS